MDFDVDGHAVYAATGGRPFDAALPSVIFVHGAAMDHTVWALQTRYFAYHGYGVLALDLPGSGRSAGPLPDDIDALAGWLVRLMDGLSIGQAALVGHSMGALVALAAAAAAPHRVRRLALLGISPSMQINDVFLDAAKRNDHLAVALMNDWGHGRASHLGGSAAPGLWTVGADTRLIERAADGVLHNGLDISRRYAGGLDAARKIVCPTTVIAAADDRMTPPRAGRKVADAITDASYTVLPDCGHMMMAERPNAVLACLKAAI